MNVRNQKYYYKVYGLNIESEILVPELMVLDNKIDKNIDVKIYYKTMPDDIKQNVNEGKKAFYNGQYVWFHIDNVGTYLIQNGDTVTIDLCENPDLNILKVYILGSVLGIILLQRNTVAIHGGSIVINNKGCIFTGDKGAGKSTLTTALRQRGYDFVSDDVGAIELSDIPMINPGFGYQKLCEDAMTKLGYDSSEYTPFRSDMNIKYIVPALDNFVSEKVPFKALFEIEQVDTQKLEVVEVTGNEKLQKIIKNVFRIEVLMYSGGVPADYFKKCLEIAKHVKFYKITRPKNQFTVNEQIDIIENLIYKKSDKILKKLG